MATIALAAAARAKALLFLSCVIAITWVTGIAVMLIAIRTNRDLDHIYPLIDAVASVVLLRYAFSLPRDFRDVFYWIVSIFVAQALLRLGLTAYLPGWTMIVLNRLFELAVFSIWLLCLARLLRIHFPGAYRRLFRRDRPPTVSRTPAASRSALERWTRNALIDLRNCDRPESEQSPIESPADEKRAPGLRPQDR